jgi:cation transport ATPase
MKNLTVIFLLLIIVSSCTLQKRRYNRGFHVEWFDSGSAQNGKTTTNKTPSPTKEEHKTAEIEAKKNFETESVETIDSSGEVIKPFTQNPEAPPYLEMDESGVFSESKINRTKDKIDVKKERLATTKVKSDKPKTWQKRHSVLMFLVAGLGLFGWFFMAAWYGSVALAAVFLGIAAVGIFFGIALWPSEKPKIKHEKDLNVDLVKRKKIVTILFYLLGTIAGLISLLYILILFTEFNIFSLGVVLLFGFLSVLLFTKARTKKKKGAERKELNTSLWISLAFAVGCLVSLFFSPFSATLFGIISFVFAVIALKEINRSHSKNGGRVLALLMIAIYAITAFFGMLGLV